MFTLDLEDAQCNVSDTISGAFIEMSYKGMTERQK
jgi:hypothetical protein